MRSLLGILAGLYIAQGLPFGFFGHAVPVLLREGGSSLTTIGFSNVIALPWALKFLWAPLFDLPALRARRRLAILVLQALTAGLILATALLDPREAMGPVLVAIAVVNLFCATQDIATDALAVDAVSPAERGRANGVQVAGYRVGMVLGVGALLAVVDTYGWDVALVTLAGALTVVSLPLVAAPPVPPSTGARHATLDALGPWLRRPGTRAWLGLLLLYKTGDSFGTAVVKPMLVDNGLGLADIGFLFGTLGSASAVAGALTGGWLYRRVPNALAAYAGLQALTILGWTLVAWHPTPAGWTTAVVVEHFFSGMATAGIFTAMMHACRPGRSAADYTVQASMVVIAQGVAALVSGVSADALGYVGHLGLATLLALVAIPAARRAPRGIWD